MDDAPPPYRARLRTRSDRNGLLLLVSSFVAVGLAFRSILAHLATDLGRAFIGHVLVWVLGFAPCMALLSRALKVSVVVSGSDLVLDGFLYHKVIPLQEVTAVAYHERGDGLVIDLRRGRPVVLWPDAAHYDDCAALLRRLRQLAG